MQLVDWPDKGAVGPLLRIFPNPMLADIYDRHISGVVGVRLARACAESGVSQREFSYP